MQLRVKALIACFSSKKGVSGTYSEAGTVTGRSVQELYLSWCQCGLGWRLCSKAAEVLQGHSPGLVLMLPWCRVRAPFTTSALKHSRIFVTGARVDLLQ